MLARPAPFYWRNHLPLDKVYISESLWQKFQRATTEHTLTRCMEECIGMAMYGNEEEDERIRFRWLARICMYRLQNELYDPELNARGNQVIRRWKTAFDAEDRYRFDFELCKASDGWQQYDTCQDAWYFGVWVHIEKREIWTYAEGDVTIVKCPDDEHLRAELASMAEFYGDPPPAMVACDMIGLQDGKLVPEGHVEAYYSPRPTI